jgi:hypothetical protein
MSNRHVALLAALALLVPIGCGSDGSDSGGSGSTDLTRAEFIKKAEAICEQTDKAQEAAQRAFQKKYPEADSTTPWEEKIIVVAGLPPVQKEAEALGALPVPSGDEEEIQAIVESMEDGVDGARSNPASLLQEGSVGPFTEAVKLAREYGFKACATPL